MLGIISLYYMSTKNCKAYEQIMQMLKYSGIFLKKQSLKLWTLSYVARSALRLTFSWKNLFSVLSLSVFLRKWKRWILKTNPSPKQINCAYLSIFCHHIRLCRRTHQSEHHIHFRLNCLPHYIHILQNRKKIIVVSFHTWDT